MAWAGSKKLRSDLARVHVWMAISVLLIGPGRFPAVAQSPDAGQAQAVKGKAPQKEDGYIFRNWQTDAGLPENSVNSLAQTPDGYIWCTTFNGLARFDGVRFDTFDAARNPEFPTSRLGELGTTREGALVIQSEFGDIVVRENGHFFRAALSKPFSGSEAIAEDDTGRLWLSDFPLAGPLWRPLLPSSTTSPAGRLRVVIPARVCFIQSDGSIIRSEGGRLWQLAESRQWEALRILAGDTQVGRLLPDRGGVWVQTQAGLHFLKSGAVARSVSLPPGSMINAAGIDPTREQLWFSDLSGRIMRLDLADGSMHEIGPVPFQKDLGTRSLLVDREGNIWAGLYSLGLMEICRKPMRIFGPSDGLLSDVVRSVAEDSDGKLWIPTTGGLNWLKNGQLEAPGGIQDKFFWSAAPAGPHRMWLSTYSAGLFLFENGQHQKVGGAMEGMEDQWLDPDFTFLFTDSRHVLWFGNSSGLFRFNGTNVESISLPANQPNDMRAAVEGRDGTIYAASNGHGIFVSDPERKTWKRLGHEAGLEDEQVYCLHLDTNDVLWIGTAGAGLARYDRSDRSRVTSFRALVPELPRTVTGIQSDNYGFLWLASTRGIYRVRIAELDAAATHSRSEANVIEYSRDSGLFSAQCTAGIQPSVTKTRDGLIWFATIGGLVCFDPAKLAPNPLPPPVVIEAVSSRGARLELTEAERVSPRQSASAPLRLREGPRAIIASPGADSIEFEFTALSFAAPKKVRFKYRMVGLQEAWTRTGERRASYQRLPPGSYTFSVTACNNDGVWDKTGASIAVVQLPFFWQTIWFKGLIGAALALAVYLLHRYRLAQVESMTRMRARIAADLHDELGSNMGAVVLNADLLKTSAALSDSEREQIADIHRMARDTAQAIREIGWFINPDFDSLDEMILRMKEIAERMLAGRQLEFAAAESLGGEALPLEFRRNVMAIYKEALNNVVRHSDAARVRIAIQVRRNIFELEIQDDGRGFDPARVQSGQGLRNLRQRAAAIHGVLRVETRLEKGTSLKFEACM